MRALPWRRPSPELLRLVGVWAAWLVILCVFQVVVAARLQPDRPDKVLGWTPSETGRAVLPCRRLLADPTLKEHVAFDSEYYLSIALAGYDDPNAEAWSPGPGGPSWFGVPSCSANVPDDWSSLNYAFLPGYPAAMRTVIEVSRFVPFTSGMSDIGRATLAGIIVSALGGLLAMLALARLWAKIDPDDAGSWGASGGLRAALYLLVFPTGFYLAQVYSEGLFIGLAFMACAMAVERRFVIAAVLGGLSVAVRPAGIFLALPIVWAALQVLRESGWLAGGAASLRRVAVPALAALVPVAAFGAWYASDLGARWRLVEEGYFSRTLDVAGSWDTWVAMVDSLLSGTDKTAAATGYATFGGGELAPESSVYIALELGALVLALVASLWLARRLPGVALFGVGVLLLAFSSAAGGEQGMDRYVLAVPAIFLMLAWLGRSQVFDRAWLIASALIMGMLATLFTYGFWVS